MPDAPANPADSLPAKSPPAAPSGASSSLVRHFRHGGLNFSSPGMHCPSHAPGAPPSDSPDTSGCALCRMRRASSVCRPGAADCAVRHVPPEVCSSAESPPAAAAPPDTALKPQNFLPSRAVSPDLRADSETFCRRRARLRARAASQSPAPSQSVRAPSRRTNASALADKSP